ncbi:MAG: YezD family protein [Methylophilaceae bacterium]
MSRPATQAKPTVAQEILRAIESVRFGSVEITVHEGRVTQIEKREKVRFTALPADKTQ